MRFINSGLNLQFTGKPYPDGRGWVVVVTNEDDLELRLDTFGTSGETLDSERFLQVCARWINDHDDFDALRKEARAAVQRMRGSHAGATPFGPAVESQLDTIARVFDRGDVYLGTGQDMGRQMFVLGPWLRYLTGDRHSTSASLKYVLGVIDRACKKATAADVQPSEFRQMRGGELPEGATWVACRAARAAGIDESHVRVVDVGSIGNGGHVVTWTDRRSGFYVTEDYNNIDIFRS